MECVDEKRNKKDSKDLRLDATHKIEKSRGGGARHILKMISG